MIDTIRNACIRKLNADPSWRWSKVERLAGGILVEGSPTIVTPKGKTKWEKERTRLLLTQEELDYEKEAYEEVTGNCHACEGTGQYTYGWSVTDGIKTKPCPYCNGTGKPLVKEA